MRERLDELLTPVDPEVLADLIAKRDLAQPRLTEAQNELASVESNLADQLAQLEGDLRFNMERLELSRDQWLIAVDDVTVAEQALIELYEDPSTAEVALAQKNIIKAQSDFQDAVEAVDEARELDFDQISLIERQIVHAVADLNDKRQKLNELESVDPLDADVADDEFWVAQANYQTAEVELQDLISPDPATVALREADVATAREDYLSAEVAVEGLVLVAPFDGVISTLDVEEGQSVNEQMIAVEIADPSVVEISGSVDEVDVLFLQVGDRASITLDALGDEAISGEISHIAAFGDSNQGVVTYPVTIQTTQPSGQLLPEGLSAVAEVVIRSQNDRLLVPIQAIFGSVDAPVVLISDNDGGLEPRNVELGISDDFWTVVEDGVSDGETIFMSVVGSDTSFFGGFRGIVGGGPPGGGRR